MEEESIRTAEQELEQEKTAIVRGWIIVAGIAVLFVIYGLFAFFVIGDNQPADWDFGAVKDTPGESVYSTYPYRDSTETPEGQHVKQRPPDAIVDLSHPTPSASFEGRPPPGKLQPEGAPKGHLKQDQRPGQPGTK